MCVGSVCTIYKRFFIEDSINYASQLWTFGVERKVHSFYYTSVYCKITNSIAKWKLHHRWRFVGKTTLSWSSMANFESTNEFNWNRSKKWRVGYKKKQIPLHNFQPSNKYLRLCKQKSKNEIFQSFWIRYFFPHLVFFFGIIPHNHTCRLWSTRM